MRKVLVHFLTSVRNLGIYMKESLATHQPAKHFSKRGQCSLGTLAQHMQQSQLKTPVHELLQVKPKLPLAHVCGAKTKGCKKGRETKIKRKKRGNELEIKLSKCACFTWKQLTMRTDIRTPNSPTGTPKKEKDNFFLYIKI